MAKVIIIGAGGVGTVVAHKCAQNPQVFNEIVLASRTKSKCDAIAQAIGASNIVTDSVDADSVPQLVELFRRHTPDLVINVALPYQDLTIMDACLECGVSFIFGLIVGSIKIVHTTFKTSVHNSQVLVRKSDIDNDVWLVFLKQSY